MIYSLDSTLHVDVRALEPILEFSERLQIRRLVRQPRAAAFSVSASPPSIRNSCGCCFQTA